MRRFPTWFLIVAALALFLPVVQSQVAIAANFSQSQAMVQVDQTPVLTIQGNAALTADFAKMTAWANVEQAAAITIVGTTNEVIVTKADATSTLCSEVQNPNDVLAAINEDSSLNVAKRSIAALSATSGVDRGQAPMNAIGEVSDSAIENTENTAWTTINGFERGTAPMFAQDIIWRTTGGEESNGVCFGDGESSGSMLVGGGESNGGILAGDEESNGSLFAGDEETNTVADEDGADISPKAWTSTV
jgi:hypothetical protein